MKLIDQYLFVVGEQLPIKGRLDIITELKSLIMDNIEERYGPDPTESEIKDFLKSFGSPDEIARRYTGEKLVISNVYTDMYFLLLMVVFGALSIAFLVVSIISIFNEQHTTGSLLRLGGMFFGNVFNAWFCATGIITLIFIVASRLTGDNFSLQKTDWNPDDLKGVEIEPEETPRSLYYAGIIIFAIFIPLLNIWPSIVNVIENVFFKTGLGEGISHRIHVPVFTTFIRILSVLWIGEVVAILHMLKSRVNNRTAALIKHSITAATLVVYGFMIFNTNVYTEYKGIIGFRLIFIIVAVVETAEFAGRLIKYGKDLIKRKLE